MSKTVKILIFIISIALILILYLIMSSKIVTIQPGDKEMTAINENLSDTLEDKIDMAELENNYKKNIKPIFLEFEAIMNEFITASGTEVFYADKGNNNQESTTTLNSQLDKYDAIDKISELKINLMDLTVPDKFRDLHLGLVISFSKIKNYINNKNEADMAEGLSMINQVKSEYNWIYEK